MTVEQLIRKLKRMPQDATVTMANNDFFINGEYKVTSVETYDGLIVEICTDYKHKIGMEYEKEQK